MNESGIYPSGRRVLVKPDEIEEVTEGGIILRTQDIERHQQAQSTGILIAAGLDAYSHAITDIYTVINGQMRLSERRVEKFTGSFAELGERVAFAKYGGLSVFGEDGVEYRILNDTDITARVSEGVVFSDIDSRRPVGGRK